MGQLASIPKDPILHNFLKDFQNLRAKFLRDMGDSDSPKPSHQRPPQNLYHYVIQIKAKSAITNYPSAIIVASNDEGKSKSKDTSSTDKVRESLPPLTWIFMALCHAHSSIMVIAAKTENQ